MKKPIPELNDIERINSLKEYRGELLDFHPDIKRWGASANWVIPEIINEADARQRYAAACNWLLTRRSWRWYEPHTQIQFLYWMKADRIMRMNHPPQKIGEAARALEDAIVNIICEQEEKELVVSE